MLVVKMAASRYRRISTLGNCVAFVIFPAAACRALRPTAPLLSFPTDPASSANVRGSMLRANLDSRQLDVVSLARTISGPGAHCSVANALTVTCGGAWRVAESTTELSCKMSVVAKAAGIGNLAERLACVQQRPAMQKARGVIQKKHLRCCVRDVV
jgi:hypothetical protein